MAKAVRKIREVIRVDRAQVVAAAEHSSQWKACSRPRSSGRTRIPSNGVASTRTSSYGAPALATALHSFEDPYLARGTAVLANKLGLTDPDALDVAEADLVEARSIQLRLAGDPPVFDFDRLLNIHGHLFQDIYSWAGEVRTVDIVKLVDESSEPFMPVSMLRFAAGNVFRDLERQNHLTGLERAEFIDRLSDFYDQVNYLHPFREGNGRTQRIFWSELARAAGYDIDWTAIPAEENNAA